LKRNYKDVAQALRNPIPVLILFDFFGFAAGFLKVTGY
jgi:hypothetical protein